jgi:hypothetical protein
MDFVPEGDGGGEQEEEGGGEGQGREVGGEGGDAATGNTVKYPSSKSMKLLTLYDDGLDEKGGEGGEFLEDERGEVSDS